MKVVHLVPYFQPGFVGGIQRYVAELAGRQQTDGIETAVYTVEMPAKGRPHSGSLPIFSRRAWGTLFRTPLLPPFLGNASCLEADVAHIHGPSPWFDLALLTARRRWRRTVLTVHNSFPASSALHRGLGAVGKRLFLHTLGLSDRVIIPHEGFLEELPGAATACGLASRLRVVPPGVDHETFRPLGLPRDPDLVLFTAHIRPEKGLHVLVEAMRTLPHLRLDVLGAVSYERRYFKAVRSHAVRCLGNRVRFVMSPDPPTLSEAYNRAACVVVPSMGLESWNLVLLEAAACGAACVRTDLPGLAWADFALTARAGDALRLAEAIRTSIGRREELGERARHAAISYSWERTHLESLAAYREALGHL